MKVRTNADTAARRRTAREFGAEGIGLCRTEHMFFDADAHQRHARDDPRRRHARAAAPRSTSCCPCSARTSPSSSRSWPACRSRSACSTRRCTSSSPPRGGDRGGGRGARASTADKLRNARAARWHEFNPMLGHRGVPPRRLLPGDRRDAGPRHLRGRHRRRAEDRRAGGAGGDGPPGRPQDRARVREEAHRCHRQGRARRRPGSPSHYQVGTMVELPRAALNAEHIAEVAEFFSFGTNDLTQTTFGISRDDAGVFLGAYLRESIIDVDPFVSIDVDGVGELVRIAAEKGRAHAARHQARHLRRARRRPRLHRASARACRARLCVVLTVPRAHRAARGGAGCFGVGG